MHCLRSDHFISPVGAITPSFTDFANASSIPASISASVMLGWGMGNFMVLLRWSLRLWLLLMTNPARARAGQRRDGDSQGPARIGRAGYLLNGPRLVHTWNCDPQACARCRR